MFRIVADRFSQCGQNILMDSIGEIQTKHLDQMLRPFWHVILYPQLLLGYAVGTQTARACLWISAELPLAEVRAILE